MELTLKTTIETSAERIYNAWLDSSEHEKMTGGEASVSNVIGDSFTAWDGYIEGTNITLEPNKRIVQSWRTSDFSDEEPDSQIEVVLEESNGTTELTLIHTNLPAHGEQYRQGWDDSYFQPMKAYFI